MTISDILQRCSHLKIEKKNDISQNYIERVFLKESIDQWEKVLSDVLGPAEKLAGENVTDFFFNLTKDYGGILDEQTLFYKKYKENSIIAMLWPWKDNNQVTLKIASFKE